MVLPFDWMSVLQLCFLTENAAGTGSVLVNVREDFPRGGIPPCTHPSLFRYMMIGATGDQIASAWEGCKASLLNPGFRAS